MSFEHSDQIFSRAESSTLRCRGALLFPLPALSACIVFTTPTGPLNSRIRLVPTSAFLANFASDRSHMVRLPLLFLSSPLWLFSPYYLTKTSLSQLLPPSLALDAAPLPIFPPSGASPSPATPPPSYAQPPPPYPPIQGTSAREQGETHNLWTQWLRMDLTKEKEGGEEGFGEVLSSSVELLRHRWL
jgi:hypothetical protein